MQRVTVLNMNLRYYYLYPGALANENKFYAPCTQIQSAIQSSRCARQEVQFDSVCTCVDRVRVLCIFSLTLILTPFPLLSLTLSKLFVYDSVISVHTFSHAQVIFH